MAVLPKYADVATTFSNNLGGTSPLSGNDVDLSNTFIEVTAIYPGKGYAQAALAGRQAYGTAYVRLSDLINYIVATAKGQ